MNEQRQAAIEEIASAPPAFQLQGISKSFDQGGGHLDILKGAELTLKDGETVALVGPSGAGKSTLLHIAGLLERPNEGKILIDGIDCGDLSDTERTMTRREKIGFVYQYHHLLGEFSAVENVMMPQLIAGLSKREARERATQLLDMVGLSERESHRPARLSGGEQQRVAIVRAIANVPRVLLADEPTGNLDPVTAGAVFTQLKRIVKSAGLAALIATHNHELARDMDRVVELRDGALVEV